MDEIWSNSVRANACNQDEDMPFYPRKLSGNVRFGKGKCANAACKQMEGLRGEPLEKGPPLELDLALLSGTPTNANQIQENRPLQAVRS